MRHLTVFNIAAGVDTWMNMLGGMVQRLTSFATSLTVTPAACMDHWSEGRLPRAVSQINYRHRLVPQACERVHGFVELFHLRTV